MPRVTLKSLGVTKEERANLESWRNGWGRLWKDELRRLWSGGTSSLDALWSKDINVLKGLKDKLAPHLDKIKVSYTGPDRD